MIGSFSRTSTHYWVDGQLDMRWSPWRPLPGPGAARALKCAATLFRLKNWGLQFWHSQFKWTNHVNTKPESPIRIRDENHKTLLIVAQPPLHNYPIDISPDTLLVVSHRITSRVLEWTWHAIYAHYVSHTNPQMLSNIMRFTVITRTAEKRRSEKTNFRNIILWHKMAGKANCIRQGVTQIWRNQNTHCTPRLLRHYKHRLHRKYLPHSKLTKL